MKAAERQIGSLKFTHHLGWNCFFTLGEQLILQLSVTHSINSPAVAPVSGAAALAAGDKFCGKTCPVGGTTIAVGLSSSNRPEFTHPGRTRKRKRVAANSCFMRLTIVKTHEKSLRAGDV
jgi:hypothetical protein